MTSKILNYLFTLINAIKSNCLVIPLTPQLQNSTFLKIYFIDSGSFFFVLFCLLWELPTQDAKKIKTRRGKERYIFLVQGQHTIDMLGEPLHDTTHSVFALS